MWIPERGRWRAAVSVAILLVLHAHRAAAKGCFLGGTAVTMADGSRRQLRDVAVGDAVASWDEEAQRPAVSTVRAVPTYQRSREELVEISLPSATLHATVDHPFWSRARRKLVSSHPNGTRDQYELDAELMSDTEEFEGERQEPVFASRVRRLQFRRLGLALAEGGDVEVMTLCLGPHHWFYAEGVRVHNKGGGGCFAPWTPVVMEDGTQRPIAEVRKGDRVASWDSEREVASSAEVLGLDVWPAGELMEVSLGPAKVAHARFLAATAPQGNKTASLAVTPDHPIYSVRHGGLVSMRPDHTKERYALSAAQMHTRELLHHHLNGTVVAEVLGAWRGAAPDRVITLRLDRHHWFYAHGVRVHNKGSSGGGSYSGGGSSGGGSSGGGGGVKTYSSASMGTHSFMGFLLMSGGSRRRHGTYEQEEGSDGVQCTMKSEAEVEAACSSRVGDEYVEDYCFPCIECESTTCVEGVTATDGYNCTEFLGEAYTECTEEGGVDWLLAVLFGLITLCSFFCLLVCAAYTIKFWQDRMGPEGVKKSLQEKHASREKMSALNGPRLGTLVLSGKYRENGDEKFTEYRFYISPDGEVSGESNDDDGRAVVDGKICIRDGNGDATTGLIAWRETRTGVYLEASGDIDIGQDGRVAVRASYISSYQGTRGSVDVSSAAAQVVPTVSCAQVVVVAERGSGAAPTGACAQVVPTVVGTAAGTGDPGKGKVAGRPREEPGDCCCLAGVPGRGLAGAWLGEQISVASPGEGNKC